MMSARADRPGGEHDVLLELAEDGDDRAGERPVELDGLLDVGDGQAVERLVEPLRLV
jgi:hypothetical protein